MRNKLVKPVPEDMKSYYKAVLRECSIGVGIDKSWNRMEA